MCLTLLESLETTLSGSVNNSKSLKTTLFWVECDWSHMYADDTILYSCAPTLGAAIVNLQSDFVAFQHKLMDSKLLLNGNKTKAMLFAQKKLCILLASSVCPDSRWYTY